MKGNSEENSETDAEDFSYPSGSTCVDADVYSEAFVEKLKMFSEDKFPVAKVAYKEVTQLERHYLSPENHVANLDARKIPDEGKNKEYKASKDDKKDEKKEVALVVTENDEEVSTKESFVMETVRIFKNKKYLQSKT